MNSKPMNQLQEELHQLDDLACRDILFYSLGYLDSVGGIAYNEFALAVESGITHHFKGEL